MPRPRVSFDIDDTLTGPAVTRVQPLPRPWRWLFPEPLRIGVPRLFAQLRADGWSVGIYTTSHRNPWAVALWLRAAGAPVRPRDVVTARHALPSPSAPSKYPPAFGFQLHVDDSPGVALEGRRHGFHVVQVAPDDQQWAEKVLRAARAQLPPQPESDSGRTPIRKVN